MIKKNQIEEQKFTVWNQSFLWTKRIVEAAHLLIILCIQVSGDTVWPGRHLHSPLKAAAPCGDPAIHL